MTPFRGVAIVGAGVAGLAAGRRLAALGHEVVVLERSRDIGGRAATRRTHGCVVDDGAQYLKLPPDAPEVRRLVLEELPAEGLVDIGRPVWTFDRDGRVRPGDEQQNAEPKWTYAEGLSALAKRLADRLDVRLETKVARVRSSAAGYEVVDAAGRVLATAKRVLMTCPAPQAVEMLLGSDVAPARCEAALMELRKARYRPILSITLGYEGPIEGTVKGGTNGNARPYYALVNTDRGHAISWLAFENDKEETRVPRNMLALVAQMSAAWSREHFDDDPDTLAALASAEVSSLLGVDLRAPTWHDVARWRYALPDSTCDLRSLNRDHHNLLFVGDYVAGGRLHLALQAGLDVASMLATV